MGRGGPVTERGKARSSQNATRHGILSAEPVLPGREQPEEWETHQRRIHECLSPEGHFERVLATRIARSLWNLQRVHRYETESIAFEQATAERDAAVQRVDDGYGKTPTPLEIEGLQEGIDSYFHLLSLLQALAVMDDSVTVPNDDAISIIEAVCTLGENPSEVPETGGEGPGLIENGAKIGWSAEDLRSDLEVIAAQRGIPPEAILPQTISVAEAQLEEMAEQLAHMERARAVLVAQAGRLRRERLLPSDRVVERVIRYEAHVSRELYKSIHELEVLQARRRGQQTPLLRVDVSGLPGE